MPKLRHTWQKTRPPPLPTWTDKRAKSVFFASYFVQVERRRSICEKHDESRVLLAVALSPAFAVPNEEGQTTCGLYRSLSAAVYYPSARARARRGTDNRVVVLAPRDSPNFFSPIRFSLSQLSYLNFDRWRKACSTQFPYRLCVCARACGEVDTEEEVTLVLFTITHWVNI